MSQARRNVFEAKRIQVIILKLQGQLQQTYWDLGKKLKIIEEKEFLDHSV